MTARLTFAVPFYSNRAFLEETIDSVLAQSVPDWELVISDDHSVEDIGPILAARADPRIRHVRNDATLGMAGNWNRCLDLATAGLVTILHADDRLLPHYAERMTEAAARHPDAIAFFCEAVIIGDGGRPALSAADLYKKVLTPRGGADVVLSGEEGLRRIMKGDFIICPTLCYRRERLGLRFSPSWKMVLDLDLKTRLLLRGDTLIGLREPAYAYRRHRDNATLRYTQSLLRFHEEIAIFGAIAERAREKGWARAATVAGRKRVIKLHLLYCILRDALTLHLGRAAATGRFLMKELRAD